MNPKIISNINNKKILDEFKTFPNQAVLDCMINSKHQSTILEFKESVLVIENNNNDCIFAFLGGELNYDELEVFNAICSRNNYIMLFSNKNNREILLGTKLWQFCKRIQYQYLGILFDDKYRNFQIQSVDYKLFPQCDQYNEINQIYGSIDKFFKYEGKCYAALDENENSMGEIFTYAQNENEIEIGIGVKKEFRNRGIATELARFFVSKYSAQGKKLIWSCFESNIGSIKTAEKARFEKRYIADFIIFKNNRIFRLYNNLEICLIFMEIFWLFKRLFMS